VTRTKTMSRCRVACAAGLAVLLALARPARPQELAVVEVEGQPLAANVLRLLDALDYLGQQAIPCEVPRAAGTLRRSNSFSILTCCWRSK